MENVVSCHHNYRVIKQSNLEFEIRDEPNDLGVPYDEYSMSPAAHDRNEGEIIYQYWHDLCVQC